MEVKYALVTGAAKGIGRAIAEELIRRDYNLLLTDIDEIHLAQTKYDLNRRYPQAVNTLDLDLTRSDAVEQLWSWTTPFHQHLSVVVNNAGYGLNGGFADIPLDRHLNVIDLNISAQLKICHVFLPVLKEFPRAYLLNVGSTTSYQSVPYLSVYAASKAFVLSFTRSLRYELRGSTVQVSCLSPGSTDTDFVNRAGMSDRIKRTAVRFNMTPERVASVAVKGLFRGREEIVPGFLNKLNARLPKFFPKALVEKIAGNIYQPREEDAYSVQAPADTGVPLSRKTVLYRYEE